MTRTTPELAPPLLTSGSHQQEDVCTPMRDSATKTALPQKCGLRCSGSEISASGRRVRGSKSDSTTDQQSMCATCTLNLLSRIKGFAAIVVWKFGEVVPAKVSSSLSRNDWKPQDVYQNSPRVVLTRALI
ncbi:hypothetical protein AVEN_148668-1 [Araneus ventricosus]|uniref:Uncharacterized protein n=1 Tax=Araneus ventricosus TaxID=182803 RepID=A0A4Y2G9L4_ARAVE|nr:hypothetical protein AVEN_148668-1 [Araneus ventricosus]